VTVGTAEGPSDGVVVGTAVGVIVVGDSVVGTDVGVLVSAHSNACSKLI
jgi:hypothetical protein